MPETPRVPPRGVDESGCLLCGCADFHLVADYPGPDRYEEAVGIDSDGYHRSWVRCASCGFVYSRYSRDPAALDKLYERVYREVIAEIRSGTTREIFERVIALPADQSETVNRISWIKRELRTLERAGLLPSDRRTRRLLDIGGATGVFAYMFGDDEWQSYIVDPAESGAFIEIDYGVPYRQQPYEPGAFGFSFDLVSLVFVLEHLRDPLATLAGVATDLAPGGTVYVEVPDAVAFEMKPSDDDIFSSCHLWMFDPLSLARLFDGAGFEMLTLTRTRTLRGHYALTALARPQLRSTSKE